ncbi:hypothetical protein Tco_0814172 [Tanacetum coccineum]
MVLAGSLSDMVYVADNLCAGIRSWCAVSFFLCVTLSDCWQPSEPEEAPDESAGLQRGLDELIERRSDGALYYLDRIWVTLKGDMRTLIMDEAHKSKYSVHPGADKMYYDLRDMIGGRE